METWQIILLGIIQGVTEFLPISSSGHLILAPLVFDFQDQGLALDAILHIATLFAIIIFFRTDLLVLFRSLLKKKDPSGHKQIAWTIIWASFPAGLGGLAFGDFIEENMRSPVLVASSLFLWSIVFWWADRMADQNKSPVHKIQNIGVKKILIIGVAQTLALIPGTSRSGITIAAGLFGGIAKETATRFSFLLGTPIILGAGLYKIVDIMGHLDQVGYSPTQIFIGFIISFSVGYASIKLLMAIVAKVGLLPFIIYRIALAIIIFFTV